MPSVRLEPTSADETATLLAEATRHRRPIVPIGAGTKMAWHHSPFADDTLVSTRGLTAGFAHYAGDLVATIPAGMTLADANAALASAGQWLPIDPAFAERATIGGIVATNDSGPRRYRYGAPRDLIVGIEVALTDGRVAKAGGRVVKNVAGYDLSRLFCGSQGSLGVITSATFKLAPIAPASCTLIATFDALDAAVTGAQALAHSTLTPSAIEIQAPGPCLLIRFESTASAASHMAETARARLAGNGANTRIVTDDDERTIWASHERHVWEPVARALQARVDATLQGSRHTMSENLTPDRDEGPRIGAIVKVCVLPSDMARVFALLDSAGADLRWTVSGQIALGVFLIRVEGASDRVATLIAQVQASAAVGGGHVRVLDAPVGVRQLLPVSPPAAAAAIMRSVKERFDPTHVLRRVPDGS